VNNITASHGHIMYSVQHTSSSIGVQCLEKQLYLIRGDSRELQPIPWKRDSCR